MLEMPDLEDVSFSSQLDEFGDEEANFSHSLSMLRFLLQELLHPVRVKGGQKGP